MCYILKNLSIKQVKIISGGQTDVDRAGLDAALESSIECGGWCPEGSGISMNPFTQQQLYQVRNGLAILLVLEFHKMKKQV